MSGRARPASLRSPPDQCGPRARRPRCPPEVELGSGDPHARPDPPAGSRTRALPEGSSLMGAALIAFALRNWLVLGAAALAFTAGTRVGGWWAHDSAYRAGWIEGRKALTLETRTLLQEKNDEAARADEHTRRRRVAHRLKPSMRPCAETGGGSPGRRRIIRRRSRAPRATTRAASRGAGEAAGGRRGQRRYGPEDAAAAQQERDRRSDLFCRQRRRGMGLSTNNRLSRLESQAERLARVEEQTRFIAEAIKEIRDKLKRR